jgi:hypothetical protein
MPSTRPPTAATPDGPPLLDPSKEDLDPAAEVDHGAARAPIGTEPADDAEDEDADPVGPPMTAATRPARAPAR